MLENIKILSGSVNNFNKLMKIRTGQIEFAGKVPLNTSGNKNAFSFSKDKRFLPTQELFCQTSYYDKN